MVIAANLNTAVNSPFPNENACLKTCLTFICKQWYYSALTLLWSWIQWDWKAADCPFQAQKSALWSQCFCQNSPTFMLHLQTKVLHSSLASWHLSWPISQENFILFRMVAKKNLHFSFISVFFSFPFVAIGDTLNSGFCSQHSLPPSGSVCATPPHLPVLLPLYAIWFMNSMNITVLFRKKTITFSFDPLPVLIVLPLIPFLLQKSLLSPFFQKYMPFLIQKSLLQCLLRTLSSVLISFVNSHHIFNLHFPQYDPWRVVVFFLPLFSSVLISHGFPCYKQYSYCNPSYFWTNYTFYLLNISTLKFVIWLPFKFIKFIIFCSAETSDAASKLHSPSTYLWTVYSFPSLKNAHVVIFLIFVTYLLSKGEHLNIGLVFSTCAVCPSCKHLLTCVNLRMELSSQVDQSSWVSRRAEPCVFLWHLGVLLSAEPHACSTEFSRAWPKTLHFFVVLMWGSSVPSVSSSAAI